MSHRFSIPVALMCGLLLVSGCQKSGPQTRPIFGKVTMNGQPVKFAEMTLTPQGGGPKMVNPGRGAYTFVTDGKYDLSKTHMAVGKVQVKIMTTAIGNFQPKDWNKLTEAETQKFQSLPKKYFAKIVDIQQDEVNLDYTDADIVQE